MSKSILSLSVAVLLGGCSLMPDYQRPAAPVPASLPEQGVYAGSTMPAAPALPDWRGFFRDAGLQQLISQALENNRDLRVAALNVETFQARYRIQRAELLPAVGVGGGGNRQRLPADLRGDGQAGISSQYEVSLGTSSWELDLFGRLRSLREAALEEYLASEQARAGVQVALVASVASAWLALQADQAQLALAEETLANYQRSFELTRRSAEVGVASELEQRQAQTLVESARVAVAQSSRQVAQDRHALQLLLGGSLPGELTTVELSASPLAPFAVGLDSTRLLQRPDIQQAEAALRSANASIGAARAAFFPNIALTASAGTASSQLSGLFDAGSGSWLFQPRIDLPIFTAGRLKASLEVAELQRDLRVAQYEQAIQNAFREVSDGLAARSTFVAQWQAQQDLVAANQAYYRLAEARYRTGVDSQLTLLDAQRQLFAARQQLIATRQAQLGSEIALYKALGGGVQ